MTSYIREVFQSKRESYLLCRFHSLFTLSHSLPSSSIPSSFILRLAVSWIVSTFDLHVQTAVQLPHHQHAASPDSLLHCPHLLHPQQRITTRACVSTKRRFSAKPLAYGLIRNHQRRTTMHLSVRRQSHGGNRQRDNSMRQFQPFMRRR